MEVKIILPDYFFDPEDLKKSCLLFMPFTETVFFSFSIGIAYNFWRQNRISSLYAPISMAIEGEDLSELLNSIKVKEVITIENEYVLSMTLFKNFNGIIRDISDMLVARAEV